MIFVDGHKVDFSTFPDGTSAFRFCPSLYKSSYYIRWLYDNDSECMQLWYLVHHIKSSGKYNLYLELPYIPNARMDRVRGADEVFTLKWFAQFINSLGFDSVIVLDPHSNVSMALIDNVKSMDVRHYINYAIQWMDSHHMNPILCYPDEGAAKRYSKLIDKDYVACIKCRDWRTGKIESLKLTDPEKVVGRNVLIVDDICSRGGTFTYTAKELKEAGAGDVMLYVTHCENTIKEGSVLTDGFISRVFTTNSILRIEDEKITVCH